MAHLASLAVASDLAVLLGGGVDSLAPPRFQPDSAVQKIAPRFWATTSWIMSLRGAGRAFARGGSGRGSLASRNLQTALGGWRARARDGHAHAKRQRQARERGHVGASREHATHRAKNEYCHSKLDQPGCKTVPRTSRKADSPPNNSKAVDAKPCSLPRSRDALARRIPSESRTDAGRVQRLLHARRCSQLWRSKPVLGGDKVKPLPR